MDDKKIRQIVKEQINRLLESKRRYRLTDLDELNEYMWLKPNMTKIGVDIFVDDGMSYVRNGHELLLFVRNSYSRNGNSFIPISISSKPRVLDDEMSFNISYNDIFDVYDFIQDNLSILRKLANQKITQEEFVRSIRHTTYRITESFLELTRWLLLGLLKVVFQWTFGWMKAERIKAMPQESSSGLQMNKEQQGNFLQCY